MIMAEEQMQSYLSYKGLITFFGIKLLYLVFSATEQTSINLPKRYLCIISSEVAMNHLKRMRNDESFRQFYTLTVEEAKDCTEEPLLPRYRRPPKKIDDGEMPHSFKSAEDMIKMHYFYAMDLIWQEINDHFDQKSLLLPKEIESLLLRASSNQDTTRIIVPECIKSIYHLDIDVQKLEIQLQMLPDLLRAYKIYIIVENLTITKVSSVTDMLTVVPMAKYIFSEIDKLLRLYLTFPVTTCTTERFLSLRSMKNYLQSTMSEERLNNVMLLHVHKRKQMH